MSRSTLIQEKDTVDAIKNLKSTTDETIIMMKTKLKNLEKKSSMLSEWIRKLSPNTNEIERVKGWPSSATGDPTDPHDDIRRSYG